MFMTDNVSGLNIPWEMLEGMIKGVSAIDTDQMNIATLEDAEQFILNYGFDHDVPEDRLELASIQTEALSFIQRRLLHPDLLQEDMHDIDCTGLEIPASIHAMDVRQLLITASQKMGLEQLWACTILKVMHIICHMNNAVLFRHYKQARGQILARYNQVVTRTPSGDILLGGADGLKLSLMGFEIKDEKSRDSMILKLLCKRENVAEEVFDMIGVRIITRTASEAIIAMEILRRNKVVMFPNIIPSRSRNSLVNFDAFKLQYQEVLERQSNLTETLYLIEHLSTDQPAQQFNPGNSSTLATYRSIHLTERHLVRFKAPGAEDETRFFFPYEIQIVDESSHQQNRDGSSAHSLYKKNQLHQARQRVLRPFFYFLRRHNV